MKVVTGPLDKKKNQLIETMTKGRMTLKLDFPWIINSFVAFLVNGGVYTYIWPRVWQWLIETNLHVTGPQSLMGLPAQALPRADSAHTPIQAVVSAFHKVFSPLFLPRAPQLYGKNRYLNPHYSQLVLLSDIKLLLCFLNAERCLGLRLGKTGQSQAADCSFPWCLLLLLSEISFMDFWLMQGLLPAGYLKFSQFICCFPPSTQRGSHSGYEDLRAWQIYSPLPFVQWLTIFVV